MKLQKTDEIVIRLYERVTKVEADLQEAKWNQSAVQVLEKEARTLCRRTPSPQKVPVTSSPLGFAPGAQSDHRGIAGGALAQAVGICICPDALGRGGRGGILRHSVEFDWAVRPGRMCRR